MGEIGKNAISDKAIKNGIRAGNGGTSASSKSDSKQNCGDSESGAFEREFVSILLGRMAAKVIILGRMGGGFDDTCDVDSGIIGGNTRSCERL